MTRRLLICSAIVGLAWPTVASAVNPRPPSAWLTVTCTDIVEVQRDTSTPQARSHLVELRRAAATAPAVPAGASFAAVLRGAATALEADLPHMRLAATRKQLGKAFLAAVARYPSRELDTAIDEVPACGVIHG
jgi:hypothetical protein